MAWIVKEGTYILYAGVTGSDALDKFISVTEKEQKSLRFKAVADYCSGKTDIKVNRYTLRWQ
jgi:hypothetical protein